MKTFKKMLQYRIKNPFGGIGNDSMQFTVLRHFKIDHKFCTRQLVEVFGFLQSPFFQLDGASPHYSAPVRHTHYEAPVG